MVNKHLLVIILLVISFDLASCNAHSTLRQDRGYPDYFYYCYYHYRWHAVYGYKPQVIGLSQHELKQLYLQANHRNTQIGNKQQNACINQPRSNNYATKNKRY
jgi:hypothetical protein